MEVELRGMIRYGDIPMRLIAFYVAVVDTPEGPCQFEYTDKEELRKRIKEMTGREPVFIWKGRDE